MYNNMIKFISSIRLENLLAKDYSVGQQKTGQRFYCEGKAEERALRAGKVRKMKYLTENVPVSLQSHL